MVGTGGSADPKTAGEGTGRMKGGVGGESASRSDDSSPESDVKKLRGRWELACVLNFLSVFKKIIWSDLKLTAEDIEMGLVESNSSNAQLHITLLKGIPPVSKSLNNPDAWITVLCKKVAPWWPWIDGEEIPLTACKGEEISRYRDLDPTNRLRILRVLCEIRADQDDIVSYINESLKQGTQMSCFCKEKFGGDGNGTTYWFDGNTMQGYRLYREVKRIGRKTKSRGNACIGFPPSLSQWETLATNLEEFNKVSTELSSSKVLPVAATGKMIETDAMPIVEKFQKNKERALKRKTREEMLIGVSRSFFGATRTTRSCRNRMPVSYTCDEFDRTILEAIQETEKMVPLNEQGKRQKPEEEKFDQHGIWGTKKSSDARNDSTESESERNKLEEPESGNDEDYGEKIVEELYEGSHLSDDGDSETTTAGSNVEKEPEELCLGERFAQESNHPNAENRIKGTKNGLRQRPVRN